MKKENIYRSSTTHSLCKRFTNISLIGWRPLFLSYVISKVAIFGMLLSRKMGLGFTNTRGCQIYRSVDCHLESISVVGRNQ